MVIGQFIFRFEVGDAYLGAVSRFMTNAFEYGDALLPEPETKVAETEGDTPSPKIGSNQPYLNLATYVSIRIVWNCALIQAQVPHGCSC